MPLDCICKQNQLEIRRRVFVSIVPTLTAFSQKSTCHNYNHSISLLKAMIKEDCAFKK